MNYLNRLSTILGIFLCSAGCICFIFSFIVAPKNLYPTWENDARIVVHALSFWLAAPLLFLLGLASFLSPIVKWPLKKALARAVIFYAVIMGSISLWQMLK